ncbi:hypothetical protein EBB07_28390 [Paenibacillaceae bacterium]|nr:hypothetical protein EBB07_28390 [Paenibacillaceae bacterium]
MFDSRMYMEFTISVCTIYLMSLLWEIIDSKQQERDYSLKASFWLATVSLIILAFINFIKR